MDKISKSLKKFSLAERKKIKVILNKIKQNNLENLQVKKLKGHDDIFRVRKGKIRIIFLKKDKKIAVLAVERRSDNTYDI